MATYSNEKAIREATIKYCETFDPELWHDQPMRTILDKKLLLDGTLADTTNPWGEVNGKMIIASDAVIECAKNLVNLVKDKAVRGYCQLLGEYLYSSVGPVRGTTSRTSLYGLQRPPLGTTSWVRIEDLDDGIPYLLPYVCCGFGVAVSCGSEDISKALLSEAKIRAECVKQEKEKWADIENDDKNSVWSTIRAQKMSDFVSVGHFVGSLFPLGHVKSTLENDAEFLKELMSSPKWLRIFTKEAFAENKEGWF